MDINWVLIIHVCFNGCMYGVPTMIIQLLGQCLLTTEYLVVLPQKTMIVLNLWQLPVNPLLDLEFMLLIAVQHLYLVLVINNIIIQWGKIDTASNNNRVQTISFPTTFKTKLVNVLVSGVLRATSYDGNDITFSFLDTNLTQIHLGRYGSNVGYVYWLVIGY